MEMIASEKVRRREELTRKIAGIAAVVLGLLPTALFFLPYLSFDFNGHQYSLTGLKSLISLGLQVQGPSGSALIGIPLLVRVAAIGGPLLGIAGVILLLCKKTVLSAASFALSGAMPILAILNVTEIRRAVTDLNITQAAINYQWPMLLALGCGIVAALFAMSAKGGERMAESIFLVFACVSVGSVVFIMLYMVMSGAPAIWQAGVGNFLFGSTWELGKGEYGTLPLTLSSICATFGAVVLGVPVGLLTAVFLAEIAHKRVAGLVRPAVELLAGIPSVIYGFFGMMVIVPAIRNFPPFQGKTIGLSLLAVILVLAIMVLPTIISTAETAMRAVPDAYREASLALGATPTATIFKVIIPAARSGILSGVILGVGRAIGETMAVLMVAGNLAKMPQLLGAVKLMTSGIAVDISYATEAQRPMLFGVGLVLFIFIMIVNISFSYISKKGVQMDAK